MHEQPPPIVDPFGEELGDWVHVEGVVPNDSRYAGGATSAIWIWQFGHHEMTRDAPLSFCRRLHIPDQA
jgi:hypothetical protein